MYQTFGESGWAGTKLAGKVDSAKTPSIRSYWEQNIHKERLEKEELARNVRPKSYGFPKWRSSDALSASLVASNSVDIPRDSRIPEDRLKKMEQTDREAVIIKHHIHQAIEPTRPLHKGKSLDSLVVQEQQQQMPNSWYDREKIRDGVNRESIANIHESRYRFENGEFNPPHHQHQRDRSYSGAGRYEVSSHPHSTVPVAPPAPPLPPKSEDILVRQNRYSECQDSVDSYVNVNPRQVSNSQSMHTINSSNTHIHNNNDNNNINYNNNNNCTYQNAYSKECQLTLEQQLLLLYVKQNPEVVSSVGVTYPEYTRLMMDDVPYRRVELRSSEDDPQNIQYSPNNQKGNGRYIKKPQVANVVQRFRKNEPVRERQDDIRPGESFVAAEIRQAREREEELKRSRSELGLPTLEDTIDSWRNGQKGFLSSQLRTAVSYDHLHQNGVQKAPSMGELSHESYGSYSRNEQGSRTDLRNPRPGYGPTPYRLQNTDDQDVMFYGPTRRQIPQLKRFD